MLIEQGHADGLLRVAYHRDRLDSVVAEAFRAHLDGIMDRGEQQILLDLSRVEFVDSAGLGALIGLTKRAKQDGRFELTGLRPRVTHLLSLTRMDEVLAIRENA
ncbi:MAG: STAS domain-containing protein [Pseudomonadota bacterium]